MKTAKYLALIMVCGDDVGGGAWAQAYPDQGRDNRGQGAPNQGGQRQNAPGQGAPDQDQPERKARRGEKKLRSIATERLGENSKLWSANQKKKKKRYIYERQTKL